MGSNKIKSMYVCSECGWESSKWVGKCQGCGSWNTMQEEIRNTAAKSTASSKTGIVSLQGVYAPPVAMRDIDTKNEERYKTNLKEFDRVLGGGIVKGSLVLLGGDPGGEESKRQIKLRADRLAVDCGNLYVITETDIEIVAQIIKNENPDLVIIDSIQTMSLNELSSSPGSVTQVRECTNLLMKTAKSLEISVIIVGHVNKDGAIAGPKVLEHIVDAVLHFEGDRQMSYRILRAVKNRYGSTNEIGVFQMTNDGLSEVENPSMMLLSGRPKNVSGTCVACAMEGSRPILAEIQGLVTNSGFGNPRRMSTGFDYNRMNLILAVLEKRAGYFFSNADTYINVVGGLRLDEPAVDLAVAMSLISSLKDTAILENALAFGLVLLFATRLRFNCLINRSASCVPNLYSRLTYCFRIS